MSIHFGTVNKKMGNMTTIRIPKKLAEKLGLIHGERVRISESCNGNKLTIHRHFSKKK